MAFQIKYVYDLVDKISPKIEKIRANIDRSADSVRKSANKMNNSFNKIGNKLEEIGKKAGQVGKDLFVKATLPIALLGGSFVKAASDYEESINKVDVAFGKASGSVKEFANAAGKNFGIDRGAALDMAAMFGDMSTSMGLSVDRASTLSTSLVGLAGDLASFKNIGVDQATTALAGVFTGETESLKRLGIVMTETNLKQFKMELGIKKNLKSFTQAEKVLLRYKFVMSKTKNAQGDFGRTNEGFANQLRILRSAWKDLSITLGVIILPLATKLINKLTSLVKWINSLSPRIQKAIIIFGGLVAVLGPLLIAISLMIPALKLLGVGFALMASPIGLVTIAILAAVAAFAYLWKDMKIIYGFLKDKFVAIFDAIAAKVRLVVDSIMNLKNLLPSMGSIKEKLGFGGGESINSNQSVSMGGTLNVNFSNMPKGTNTNFSPIPNNPFNLGINTTYAAS